MHRSVQTFYLNYYLLVKFKFCLNDTESVDMDRNNFESFFLSSVNRLDLNFYSSYLTHLSAPLNQWLNNFKFSYNQPPALSKKFKNIEILRYFCGICE